MGAACASSTPQLEKSREIDRLIKKQTNKQQSHCILLLGPGESGKSTIFKQMQIISAVTTFTDEERIRYRTVIYANCISEMKILIQNSYHLKNDLRKNSVPLAMKIMQLPDTGNNWSTEVGTAIQELWQDEAIRKTFDKRDECFQLNDSASYFFDEIARFLPDDYIPSIQDILRVRIRTCGIEEATFKFDNTLYKVIDVGGQRAERRKWIHCFSDVTAVIFCASLMGYCQFLREKGDVNIMKESLELFYEVASSPHLVENSLILFLNKEDLFDIRFDPEKLAHFFEGFVGQSVDDGKKYIKQRFEEIVPDGKKVFTHITIAIDTKNIESVIKDLRTTVLMDNIDAILV